MLQVGERYELLKVLGYGSYSAVVLALDRSTGEKVRPLPLHCIIKQACWHEADGQEQMVLTCQGGMALLATHGRIDHAFDSQAAVATGVPTMQPVMLLCFVSCRVLQCTLRWLAGGAQASGRCAAVARPVQARAPRDLHPAPLVSGLFPGLGDSCRFCRGLWLLACKQLAAADCKL